MLDLVLKRHSIAFRVSVKSIVSILMVVVAVALPQIFHIAGGVSAGAAYLPMYAPVLLAGCLLGWQWGLGVGILSPLVSFGFSSIALDSAMPALSRLPYMGVELSVFGLVSGLFSKKIQTNSLFAVPAVILSQICGRTVYVIYNLIAGRQFPELLTAIQTGLIGLYLQAAVIPFAVILLSIVLKREREEQGNE